MCVTRSHGEKSGTVSLVFGLCAHQGSHCQRIRSMPPTNTNTGSKDMKIQKQCLSHSAVEWGFLAKFKYSVLTLIYIKLKRNIWVLQKKNWWDPSLWRAPHYSDITGCLEKGISWQKILKFRAFSSSAPRPLWSWKLRASRRRAALSSRPELLYRS